jgi:hypothetical protein
MKSNISIAYSYIEQMLPPKAFNVSVHKAFLDFYASVKNKKIEDKCIQFMLFRQKFAGYVINEAFEGEKDYTTLNSVYDYFDCSLSVVFFADDLGLKPTHEVLDSEFYFSMLPFVVDRIEFPSIMKDKIIASFNFKNRSQIRLQRRNYLANMMLCSREFVNQVTSKLAEHHKRIPTFVEMEKVINHKRNKNNFLLNVANSTAHFEKLMSKQKIAGGKYIVYRGYDIDANEDILVGRKIRLQDANKSISFTANTIVATMFSNYKRSEIAEQEDATTYDDRITLVSSLVGKDKMIPYKRKESRKHILAKYELDEEDIIITPFSTSTPECEVLAIPDSARLVRYKILYAS